MHFVVGLIIGFCEGVLVCDWLRERFSSKTAQIGPVKPK